MFAVRTAPASSTSSGWGTDLRRSHPAAPDPIGAPHVTRDTMLPFCGILRYRTGKGRFDRP